jgi:alpha-mannosidase
VQLGRQTGCLPTELSFIDIDSPNLVLSAVTKDEQRDSVLVRCFNPTDKDINATVTAGFDFDAAFAATLAGDRGETLKAAGRTVSLTVRGGRIVTIEFELKK